MEGIKQLLKGVVIGVVLLLAVIGLINIAGDKNKATDITDKITDNHSATNPAATNIEAPAISINTPSSQQIPENTAPENTANQPVSTAQNNQTNETSDNAPVTTDIANNNTEPENQPFKPELVEEPASYGKLSLSIKSTGENPSQKAAFVVINEKKQRVAESMDVSNASFRLATGKYKVVALVGEQTVTADIDVQKDQTSSKIFLIKPPVTTGILQVSAVSDKTGQAVKTDFIVQKLSGERVGIRQQVSSTLFKLEAGKYKITAKNGELNAIRIVKLAPDTSITQQFRLTPQIEDTAIQAAEQPPASGKLRLSALDETSGNRLIADFIIAGADGKPLRQISSTENAQMTLPAGKYQIRVTGPNGQSSRDISLKPGQTLSETFKFHISHPSSHPSVTEKEIHSGQDSTEKRSNQQQAGQGTLKLSAIDALSKRPLKSNFYIQTTNGKHISNKNYTDSAVFKLDKGQYKITIKSRDRKTLTKIISINAGSKLNQIYSLQSLNSAPIWKTTRDDPKTIPQSEKVKQTRVHGAGTLVVRMQPSRGHKTNRNNLISNFLIKTRTGNKIAEINQTQTATIKLDEGEYVISAIHKNQKHSQTIKIEANKTVLVNFNEADFHPISKQLTKGKLRSKVIAANGRPLKANLTVRNLRGRIVRRANNVSTAEFELPAKPHTISVNYGGLSGSERVNIIPGQTTVQTFTISPAPATRRNPQSQNNDAPDLRDVLKDKIKEELKRVIR